MNILIIALAVLTFMVATAIFIKFVLPELKALTVKGKVTEIAEKTEWENYMNYGKQGYKQKEIPNK